MTGSITDSPIVYIPEPAKLITVVVIQLDGEVIEVRRPAPNTPHNAPRIVMVSDNGEQPREPAASASQARLTFRLSSGRSAKNSRLPLSPTASSLPALSRLKPTVTLKA